MHFTTLLGLAAGAQALSTGFNYGATQSDGSTPMLQADYEAMFKRAQQLQGTNGEFTSARLYTNIQAGTTNTYSEAFQAAIDTKTSLLLGIWGSAGQTTVTNELDALTSAISDLGSSFTSLVVAISVGSEDLYRVSPTGIENDSGAGATPDELVSYIQQTKKAISGTALSGATIGHVDTWTAWANSSNDAVIQAVDWLGMDTYPYFENTEANSIDNAKSLFYSAFDATQSAAGGKDVWITETGWPVSGKTSGQAVPSTANAETYWQEIACAIIPKYNVWWYTLDDSIPTTPNPSFGIIGSDLSSAQLYDLSCKANSTATATSSSSATSTGKGAQKTSGHGVGGPYGNSNSTASGYASATGMASGMSTAAASTGYAATATGGSGAASSGAAVPTGVAGTSGAATHGSAMGAAILAVFALVAAY